MKRAGNICIILGLLLITGALVLFIHNVAEAAEAGKAAETVRQTLTEAISGAEDEPYGNVAWNPGGWEGDGTVAPKMPVSVVDGRSYIGIIECPSADISLPVLAEWSYDDLKIAPCRYSGSVYTDDAVICAHNYITHFAFLLRLGIGSDIYFMTVNGEVFHYVVSNRETLRPTEVEKLTDPGQDWDLTLFTCDYGGRTRCAVRCVKADAE